MTEGYSLKLCLFDFVPNLAFLVGAIFLVRAARLARGRRCAWLVASGSLLIFLGGMLKAIWKLLLTTGVGDVRLLSEVQFVLLAPGFLLLFIGVLVWARGDRLGARASGRPVLPAMAVWKIPFLAVTTLCSVGAYGLLAYIAFRRGARLAGALFIVALLGLLAMSGMAGGGQSVARQWIEEGINSFGQIVFALGSYLLHRTSGRMAREAGRV